MQRQASPLSRALDWQRLAIWKRGADGSIVELMDFGILAGKIAEGAGADVFQDDDLLPKVQGKEWNDVTILDLVEKCEVTRDGEMTITFKKGQEGKGKSFVMVAGFEADEPGVKETELKGHVSKLTVRYHTGKVNLNYNTDSFLKAAYVNERDPILNMYFLSSLVFPSGRRLVDPEKVKDIQFRFPLEHDVNDPNVLPASIRRQCNACAALLNQVMANLEESVGNVAFMADVSTEGKILPTGQVGRRIFSEIRLPAQEVNLLHRLKTQRDSGASAQTIRDTTKLLNRVLIDRLLMHHWRGDRYLFSSSVFRSYSELTDTPNNPFTPVERGQLIGGKVTRPVVPPPTPLLAITREVAE